MSKLLRDEARRNFPPKSWAPSKAKIEMKRSKRRRRLLIEDIEPNRELTSKDMDLQYLEIRKGFTYKYRAFWKVKCCQSIFLMYSSDILRSLKFTLDFRYFLP